MSDLTPDHLVEMQIADIRLAAAKMSGPQRRNFIAEMSLKYCNGNPRLTENTFGWSRITVATGLGEKRTGIKCIGLQSSCCGNKRWEQKHPDIAEFLFKTVEKQSQQDATFQTSIAYTRLTAQSALEALTTRNLFFSITLTDKPRFANMIADWFVLFLSRYAGC